MVILASQDNVTLVEFEMGNLSEEETCFERMEDAEYINHCIYYIEVSVTNCIELHVGGGIPDICQLWYTATLLRPVKSTPKSA